jgi:hypothetical protein
MWTKGRPVPTAEHGVMAATLGLRPRAAVAYRAKQIPPGAPATRRPRMSRPG